MVRRVVCISMLLGLTSASKDQQACEADDCEEAEEVGLLQHGQRLGPLPDDCITEADMDATIDAFMGAVVAIGKEAMNCTAAKSAALGALNAVYAYDVPDVTVMFKPTLTWYPHVYRPTKESALSYFVGTCVCPGAIVPQAEAPEGCGLEEGYYGSDSGFWIAKVERGGTAKGGKPGSNFWFNTGGRFCDAALAQGPICFTYAGARAGAGPDSATPTCVDKTFGFVRNPDKSKGALRSLLSTHHSSLQDHGC